MRHYIFWTIIYISFSCQNKNSNEELNVSYTIDTVIINSNSRLFDLGGFMITSDLNKEKNTLYLYNDFDLSIDQIDLNKKEFVKKISFEPEGNNGVGTHLLSIQTLNDSLFYLKSFNKSIVINKEGNICRRINWINSINNNIFKSGDVPRIEVAVLNEDLNVFGLKFNYKEKNVSLVVLSLSENKERIIDIDPENSFYNYFLNYDENNFLAPQVFLHYENDLILVSHEFSNEIIILDTSGNLKKTISYTSHLTPTKGEIPTTREGSKDQIGKIYQRFLEQVRYESPVWDEVNKRYYRLSSKRIFEDKLNEKKLLPNLKKNRVFLSIFDEKFRLISELELFQLSEERIKYFAKNGKLWVCNNFFDELGFLVFDLKGIN